MTVNTRVIGTIRCTDALKSVVERTAAKYGLPISEVVRCTARRYLHGGKPVTGFPVPKAVTEPGGEFLRIAGGITIPDMCTERHFRKVLYLRCMEELAKPETPRFTPQSVEGVDYVVERCGE